MPGSTGPRPVRTVVGQGIAKLRCADLAVLLACVLSSTLSTAATAQEVSKIPYRGTPETVSLGQPPRFHSLWGPSLGWDYKGGRFAGRLNLGVSTELFLPQIGFLDFAMEGSLGFLGDEADGALGAYLRFPYANPGLEYNFPDKRFYFKLTAIGAPRRGGIFGIGDRIRLDWIPAKGLVQLGFAIEQPFGTYRRNRPMNRHLYLGEEPMPDFGSGTGPAYPKAAVEEALASMHWMDLLSTPALGLYDRDDKRSRWKFDERVGVLEEHFVSTGRSFAEEDSAYHASLDRAFAAAAGEVYGDSLAREAERVLWEAVVVPTNRLFGRLKKPINLSSFCRKAAQEFSVALGAFALEDAKNEAAMQMFAGMLEQCNEVARAQKKRWDDSRMVWLPPQYGLRPEQYDSQPELNERVEQLTGKTFSRNNDIGYLFADDFYYYYRSIILETQYYQVTIIHDFRNKTGPHFDQAAWSIVADGYLEAFIRAVHQMDRGERDVLPEFTLFLDEHYYRQNKSRRIITFLEHLFEADPVTLADTVLQNRVRAQQIRLHDAVAGSRALQRFQRDYPKNAIRVNVNITHQFDPTFKEDAIARDHRKLAFRDVFEEDPGSGIAIITGEGIGEHYVGPSWEDRSLVLRGPELVRLKSDARELFLDQGFRPDQVPFFLRARPYPSDYADRCARLGQDGWGTRALLAMNEPGFLPKPASVTRMAIYSLMPKGSVLLAPDSIWASDFWAALFLGIALRGVHVYAIAPAAEHAPSNAGPTLELIRETLAAMMRGWELLGPQIAHGGGSLHVGIFTADYDVCNPLERVQILLRADSTLAAGGLGLHAALREVLVEEESLLLRQPPAPAAHVVMDSHPRSTQLHQKTQFFATAEGMRILGRPEWAGFLRKYLELHRVRCQSADEARGAANPRWLSAPADPAASAPPLLEAFQAALAEESPEDVERVAYFLSIGSLNQDRRGMLLDGEILVTVPGYEALVTLMDFAFVLRGCEWVQSSQHVDDYYPKAGSLMKKISRWIHNLI